MAMDYRASGPEKMTNDEWADLSTFGAAQPIRHSSFVI
jgi:hypothetical protein